HTARGVQHKQDIGLPAARLRGEVHLGLFRIGRARAEQHAEENQQTPAQLVLNVLHLSPSGGERHSLPFHHNSSPARSPKRVISCTWVSDRLKAGISASATMTKS